MRVPLTRKNSEMVGRDRKGSDGERGKVGTLLELGVVSACIDSLAESRDDLEGI